ncbi:DUF799 family lipoprotein [bacterium]|nr:DUF799 family lipoprotein [bacterium]
MLVKTITRVSIYICFGCVAGMLFTGCAGKDTRSVNKVIEIPFVEVPLDVTIAENFKESVPVTVAVLPFKFTDESLNREVTAYDDDGKLSKEEQRLYARTELRRIFYNMFSTLSYIDVNLTIVDETLAEHGYNDLNRLYQLDPSQFKTMLGADAVIKGELTQAHNFTAGLAAETVIEGTLSLVSTRTGDVLWKANHYEANKGNLLKNSSELLDLIESQVQNANVELTFTRVAEEFSRKLVNSIPDEEQVILSSIISHPAIQEVRMEGAASDTLVFYPGGVITVTMEAEHGMVASFDIGLWKLGIPMLETSPGRYTGSYHVQYNDETADQPIAGKLTNRHGISSVKFVETTRITCKGKYLPAPVQLNGSVRAGTQEISLTWQDTEKQADQFMVFRADNDNPLYQKRAAVSGTSYTDTIDSAEITTCTYQIIAQNNAGTVSLPSEPLTITITKE